MLSLKQNITYFFFFFSILLQEAEMAVCMYQSLIMGCLVFHMCRKDEPGRWEEI